MKREPTIKNVLAWSRLNPPDDPAARVLLRVARAANMKTGVSLSADDTALLHANADKMTETVLAECVRYELLVSALDTARAKRSEKPTVVTARMAKQIRAARLSGLTYAQIAAQFKIGIQTAARHSSEINAEKMRQHERKRHLRLYNDPAYADKLEKKRKRAREMSRIQRASV